MPRNPLLRTPTTHPWPVRWSVLASLVRLPAGRPLARHGGPGDRRSTTGPSALRNPQAQGVAAGCPRLGVRSPRAGCPAPSTISGSPSRSSTRSDWTAVRSLSLAGLTEVAGPGRRPRRRAAAAAARRDRRPPPASPAAMWSRRALAGPGYRRHGGELSRAVEEFLAAASTARADGQVLFEILALHSAARLGEPQVADRV